jgi:small subunit ribosomal protein S4
MAVYHDARCRLCRREGMKLFLKGQRCFSDKCAFERRGYAPGEHGKSRRIKETNYGQQLREKQKARRIYGLLEKQFRLTYSKAVKMPGVTGENLLRLLELRVDNVVFRAGFASSRNQARQFVRHGHVAVNGKRVTVPSYTLRKGDVVQLRDKARRMIVIRHNIDTLDRLVPQWLEVEPGELEAAVRDLPLREQIDIPVREQLIVELYSK